MSASISEEILFGTTEGVKKLIKGGSDVNEKDAYGFTPLIEATIKNNIEVAQLLLQHGAKIDQEDISGQTALQWAVNRYNVEFCQFFLENKANPNHYSADGQPILVYPILRHQEDIVKMLLDHGASQVFAEDFINAKLIGHRYELTGEGDIINARGRFITLDFEGFYLEFTVGLIYRSLFNFLQTDKGKSFKSYSTVLQKILRMLRTASGLIQYKYTTTGPKEHEATIRKVLNDDMSVIPVSYAGHAITFVNYRNCFAKCDRGVSNITDTVIIYEVKNPYALNVDFLKDLMYDNKTDEYINTEIKKILNLQPFITLPTKMQIAGNCSWANVEASVTAMLFLLLFKGNVYDKIGIANLKKDIMNFYDVWVEWDKDRALDECIQSFHQVDKARKASKASIMATILFQRCSYKKPREVERAKAILEILTIPDFNYILNSYIKIYCSKASGHIGTDFTQLLSVCGLNLKTLQLE